MTNGQTFSRRSLIKWLISDDLGWGHKLGPVADNWNIWHLSYYCNALLVHTFSHFIWYFISMFKMIMVTFKLIWQNWHQSLHVYICCISQAKTDTHQRRLMVLMSFCSKFIRVYMYTNNDCNIERSDKFTAKIKWCSFFASHNTFFTTNIDIKEKQQTKN